MSKRTSYRVCERCRGPLDPLKRRQKYCSGRCRILAWAIRELEKEKKDGSETT